MALVLNSRLRHNTDKSICAICGRQHGITYDFKSTLNAKGIKGARATVECVRKLNQQQGAAANGPDPVFLNGTING